MLQFKKIKNVEEIEIEIKENKIILPSFAILVQPLYGSATVPPFLPSLLLCSSHVRPLFVLLASNH